MAAASANHDYLKLESNAAARQLINTKGKKDEKILYSNIEVKINRKRKSQNRVLMITDKAIYNLKPGDYATLKRRILIENLGGITIAEAANDFVIHIPDEYDYRYKSEKREIILDILTKEYARITRKKLPIKNLKDDGEESIDDLVVTRDKAIFQTREDVLKRKQELLKGEVATIDDDTGEPIAFNDKFKENDKVNLDSFEPLRVLGRGAFGKVLQVRKKDTGQIYAMKILKKTMVFARKQVEHTKAERQVLAAFQHPFLMGLRYAFQTETRLYLVMDFYRGGELFFHLRKVKRFTEEQAKLFVAEVALALGHLHSLDFIYRDLKPENILMDDNGHLCLTDFGLAKHINPEGEEAHSFVGTPEYLAPEMVQGSGHAKAVDWWCLGIFLYELTVGVTPFYSGNVDEMYHKIVHAKLKFPPRLSENCRDLITRLLQRDPAQRLGSGVSGSTITDVDEIKAHKFFETIDWEKLLRKEVDSTYKPMIDSDPSSTANFHESKETIAETVIPDAELNKLGPDAKFDSWTFDSKKADSKIKT